MSRKIEIVMVRMYRVIDNETQAVVSETLDYREAERTAGFSAFYSLSDCVNWDTNSQGDCGGRVEEVPGSIVLMCENCRNKGEK